MLQSFSSSTKLKRMQARTLSEPFPAFVQHKCRVLAGAHCIDHAEPIGMSDIEGDLAQCPYCKRVLATSERDAVKL